ncbi:MAG: hypothetical protein WKF57_18615, partial [Nakamurella sp.]
MTDSQTPFHDLDTYNALPRLNGLAMSPDGERLVTTVQLLDEKSTKWINSLWEIDTRDRRPAQRLTRSAKGESSPAFTADGDLLFLSARPDPDKSEDESPAQLWSLPAAGGEASVLLSRKGGIDAVHTARAASTVFVSAGLLPGADGAGEQEKLDAELRTARKDTKVAAILHTGYPVRFWDHDLGPAQPHLLEVDECRDLTPGIGAALQHAEPRVSPDGSVVVTSVMVPLARGASAFDLVRIDVATAERTTLLSSRDADGGPGEFDYSSGPISPDGATVVVSVDQRSTPATAPATTLGLLDVAGGELRPLATDWDRWPTPVAWFPDGGARRVMAADNRRAPRFRLVVPPGAVPAL